MKFDHYKFMFLCLNYINIETSMFNIYYKFKRIKVTEQKIDRRKTENPRKPKKTSNKGGRLTNSFPVAEFSLALWISDESNLLDTHYVYILQTNTLWFTVPIRCLCLFCELMNNFRFYLLSKYIVFMWDCKIFFSAHAVFRTQQVLFFK